MASGILFTAGSQIHGPDSSGQWCLYKASKIFFFPFRCGQYVCQGGEAEDCSGKIDLNKCSVAGMSPLVPSVDETEVGLTSFWGQS